MCRERFDFPEGLSCYLNPGKVWHRARITESLSARTDLPRLFSLPWDDGGVFLVQPNDSEHNLRGTCYSTTKCLVERAVSLSQSPPAPSPSISLFNHHTAVKRPFNPDVRRAVTKQQKRTKHSALLPVCAVWDVNQPSARRLLEEGAGLRFGLAFNNIFPPNLRRRRKPARQWQNGAVGLEAGSVLPMLQRGKI